MEWIKIFESEEAARAKVAHGRNQLLVINGVRICLLLYEGQFYAVQDSCTHNGESLCKGHLNYMGEIICPWHNYQFDVRSGRESASRSADLKTYPVKCDHTGFYVGIG